MELNASLMTAGGYARRGDVVIPSARVVVQVDSEAFHTGIRAEADMRRDADWLSMGYRTVRVSPRRVRRELAVVAHEIARVCLMPFGPAWDGMEGIK